MKKNSRLFRPAIFTLLLGLTITACNNKDKNKDSDDQPTINKSPNCEIVSPPNGSTISQGESINIEVQATDDDGSITNVSLLANNDTLGSKASVPYIFNWDTKNYSEGTYSIKAIATDNKGYEKSDNIELVVIGGSVTSGDTVFPGNILNASGFTVYTVTDQNQNYAGYLLGSNGYADISKAQHFKLNENPYSIKGGMFWLGVKHVGSNADLNFKIWDMNGNNGYTTQGEGNQNCPNTELISKSVPISDIDTTSQLNEAHIEMFDNPIEVTSDYAMGIDLHNLYASGDSVALVSSIDGDANNMELSWEQWSNGQWTTIAYSYSGLDIDIAIFPILASETAKIGGNNFVFGMKMSKAKRAFSRNHIKIDFETKSYAYEVILEVFDLTGAKVISKDLGAKEAGLHATYISRNNLPSGKYIYVLQTNGKKLAKELIIN